MFLTHINLKNTYINSLIPDNIKHKDASYINKYIWDKNKIDLLRELVIAEEGRIAYYKDNPLTSIKELLKYSDIIQDKLSDWDKEFLISIKEQDILSIKQRAICLRLINSINYTMWKSGLDRKWLINKYNDVNEIYTEDEIITDKKSLIGDFPIIKEDFSDIMESTLYKHQELRVNFFITRPDNSCIEASTVGSGKTITGLTYSEYLYNQELIKHTYVICPLVMVETWKREILKHTKAKDLSKYTILNYEKITKYNFENSKDCLIIFDEAHRLKAINGVRFKHMTKFKFKYTLCMSATIVANQYDELRAIYKLLNKKIPLKKGNIDLSALKKDLIRISQDMLELPELATKTIPLELDNKKEYTALEHSVYEDIRKDKENAIKEGKRPPNELVRLLRLNQYCSNRNIVMEKQLAFTETNKFKAVLEILADNPDKQFIIWSNFVPTVKQLQEDLSEYYSCKCIYGDIKQSDRDIMLDDFRANKFQILIANPSTMNTGVTLVNATRMIYFDRDFSSIKFIQSRGRFFRIGQDKNCVMYNLYYSNTIEEKIIERLDEKEDMINNILEHGQTLR